MASENVDLRGQVSKPNTSISVVQKMQLKKEIGAGKSFFSLLCFIQVLQYGVDQGKRLLLSGGSSVLDPSNPAAMMSGDSHHGATSIGTEIREMTDEQVRAAKGLRVRPH